MQRTSLVALASILVACGGGAASGGGSTTTSQGGATYEVHLTRRPPVGFSWSERAHFAGTQVTRVTDAQGTVVSEQSQSTDLLLAGRYTVSAVGPDGDPTVLELALQLFSVDTGHGVTVPQLPATLRIDRRGEGTIAGAAGEAIDPTLVTHLRSIVPDRMPPVNDDLVFGTRERVSVGAQWPIDAAGAAQGLSALHLTVTPANVSGTTTLVSFDASHGHDALELRTAVQAHHVGMPGLPPGSVEQRADVAAAIDAIVPIDPTLPPIAESEGVQVEVVVTVPTPSGAQTVSVTAHQEMEHAREF
jgi:hypothetical protein